MPHSWLFFLFFYIMMSPPAEGQLCSWNSPFTCHYVGAHLGWLGLSAPEGVPTPDAGREESFGPLLNNSYEIRLLEVWVLISKRHRNWDYRGILNLENWLLLSLFHLHSCGELMVEEFTFGTGKGLLILFSRALFLNFDLLSCISLGFCWKLCTFSTEKCME